MKALLRRLPRRRRTRAAAAVLLLLALGGLLTALFPGCQAVYLGRQALGALRIISNRVPIDAALLSRLSSEEREKLDWVARVREFAASELGLELDDSYTTYYDTRGEPISYIVAAAHPFALEPYRWRFPITGRVPYKGHFNLAEARAERDRLAAAGWDAVWLPVRAFSSLGWFSDPVLSTMLRMSKGQLADLLIHETTHRTIYFKDRATLNESLATVVAREGTERLLIRTFGEESDELRRYRERTVREDLRDGILERLWGDLDAVYRSRLPDEAKLRHKVELFAAAEKALQGAGLNEKLEPSNAYLVLDHHYSELIPFLKGAQKALGGHPRDLVGSLKALRKAKDPLAALREQLAGLATASSADPREVRLAPRQ